MHDIQEKYNQLKELLNYQDMKVILACGLSHRNLAKLANKLKIHPKDAKIGELSAEDLAGLLAEGVFSDFNVFKKVEESLDLYSAGAMKAINDNKLVEFRNSIQKDKGPRGKADKARLVWALLMNTSSENIKEGKKLISELIPKDNSIITDKEDGIGIADKDRQTRTKKRQRDFMLKAKPAKTPNHNLESEISRLKSEKEVLKKKITKLTQQFQNARESSKVKDMERKLRLLEKENRETKEKLNKDYISKDEFDALKKETDRVYQLYKTAEKANKNNSVEVNYTPDHVSFWKGFKRRLTKRGQFLKRRWFIRKGKNCRVGIFVDVQNMFYSAKNLYHGRLDFEKFLELALQGRKLVQATAYIVKTPEIDQSKFINLLKNNEYLVKTIDLKTGMNGYAKGNWDVGMVMDIFELADKLDVIALASGDGDFVPLVKYLQKRGIRVEVYGFAYNTAIDLKECADQFYPLQEDILIKDQRGMVKQH